MEPSPATSRRRSPGTTLCTGVPAMTGYAAAPGRTSSWTESALTSWTEGSGSISCTSVPTVRWIAGGTWSEWSTRLAPAPEVASMRIQTAFHGGMIGALMVLLLACPANAGHWRDFVHDHSSDGVPFRPEGLSELIDRFGEHCSDRANNARTWFPSAV